MISPLNGAFPLSRRRSEEGGEAPDYNGYQSKLIVSKKHKDGQRIFMDGTERGNRWREETK